MTELRCEALSKELDAASAANDVEKEAEITPKLSKLEQQRLHVRGLRVCQDEDCKLPQNRDRTGAINIGLQFERLFAGKGPIRGMTAEERQFHRLRTALVADKCEECDDT